MARKNRILHSSSDPQEFPHRFLLRRGNEFYRIADLQVVSEPGDRLSVYLKPPIDSLYQSRKPTNKMSLHAGGFIDISLNNDITKGEACFNPYASWHGSGKAHINGYGTKGLEREAVLKDSEAVAISDIGVSPHIIFTGIFPLSSLSHVKTLPPSADFDGNYIEVSSKPFRSTEMDKKSTAHFVLDMAELRPGSIVMDVMVHNRGADMDIEKNHPYPEDSEMYYVAPPLKIAPSDSLCPAVSVFFYQPVDGNDQVTVEKQPSTIWIRSKGAQADQFFQYEPI